MLHCVRGQRHHLHIFQICSVQSNIFSCITLSYTAAHWSSMKITSNKKTSPLGWFPTYSFQHISLSDILHSTYIYCSLSYLVYSMWIFYRNFITWKNISCHTHTHKRDSNTHSCMKKTWSQPKKVRNNWKT